MLKLLIVLALVVGLALWLLKGRRRGPGETGGAERPAAPRGAAEMVACAHCGLHLPKPEAVFDPSGQPYCGAAHRLAGPRRP